MLDRGPFTSTSASRDTWVASFYLFVNGMDHNFTSMLLLQTLPYYPQVFGELALLHASMAANGTPIPGRDPKNSGFREY